MKTNNSTFRVPHTVNILAVIAVVFCTLGTGVQTAQAQDQTPSGGPVILQGDMVNVSMSANGMPIPFNLTLMAVDPDGVEGLVWSLHTPPAHGAAEVEPMGESVGVNYIPEDGYVGEDIFAVRVTAPDGGEDVIIVVVRVEEVPEEGMVTAQSDEEVSALAGSPHIELELSSNSIRAIDWPAGTVLTLTIDDMSNGVGVDYTSTTTAEELTSYTEANFGSSPFHLYPGDIIVISGGGVTKTITISFQFSGTSISENTVFGTANPGDAIEVSVYKLTIGYVTMNVTTDSTGAWVADYDTTAYHIREWDGGYALFVDADGDETRYSYSIYAASISVVVNQSVYISGWEVGLPVTLTIDDNSNGSGVDFTDIGSVIENRDGYGFVYFYPDNFLLSAYDRVSLTNGTTTKTYYVSSISISSINVENDTVSGSSPLGNLFVYVCNGVTCSSRQFFEHVGSWTADFSVAGSRSGEIILDILPGYYVAVSIGETDGSTSISYTDSALSPSLSSISPETVHRGQGQFILTVNGSNFSHDSRIMWDTSPLQTIYVSSTQLTATIPSGLTNSTDAVDITVYTPGVGSPLPIRFSVTSFYDVPGTSSIWRWVEGLYAQGITGGCANTPLRYCPDNAVTRTQMAVFLLRAMNGGSYTPPTDLTNVFSDVPTAGNEWAQNWINQFYLSGITSGCSTSPMNYCPDNSVTRAQMAIFLLRAEHGSSYTPPAATGIFADLPLPANASIAAWVEQLYNEGITSGCSTDPLNYCPNAPVTRAQMAIFIDRTFEFPLAPEVLLE
jgi:hypothetical protein